MKIENKINVEGNFRSSSLRADKVGVWVFYSDEVSKKNVYKRVNILIHEISFWRFTLNLYE